MGEQKILSKGKVPATEKEIKEVVDTIICTIDSVNDNDLSKVKPLLDKYEEYLSDDDRISIERSIIEQLLEQIFIKHLELNLYRMI